MTQKFPLWLRVPVSALALTLAACSSGDSASTVVPGKTTGPGMEIVVRAPDPPKVGDNPIEITVRKDAAPIQDASVTAMFSMPAMPSMNMPEMHAGTTLKHEDGGVFRGTVRLSMAGTWNATVTVARGDEVLGTSSHSIVAK